MIRIMKKGFTIVELLVSISILVFIGSGMFAAYREFARREVLDSTYQELKSNLSFVRQQALSGVKPTGCTEPLNAYVVTFTNSSYTFSAVCGASTTIGVKTYNLASGVEFTATRPTSIRYKVVGDGVIVSGGTTITIRTTLGGERTRSVTLNNQGLIQ